MTKTNLTLALLQKEAKTFAQIESTHDESSLFGSSDGKAIGTYLEQKFHKYLHKKYHYIAGSSAKGIDFPELCVDIKVTSINQPQSSCPFTSARQKVFGLGYALLVFVYQKNSDNKNQTVRLDIKHAVFVESHRTADFQMTSQIRKIIQNDGNVEDIVAYFSERFLPVDEIQAKVLAEEVLKQPPEIGYITISNALQWRLQYSRIIQQAGSIKGIHKIL